MDVIGHRGGASLGPENTLEAIDAALAAGAGGVEVDVRSTADGALVLMHDPDVARTTDGTGRVDETTLEAIQKLDAGIRVSAKARVPTLGEVLGAVPRDRVLIVEIKGHPWEAGHDPSEPTARSVAAMLSKEPVRRLVVSSFNPFALRALREAAPGIRTAVLTSAAFDLASNLSAAVDGGHDECHVPAAILEESFIERVHVAGKRVVAWTVNDDDLVRTFSSWGVDGVISDDPGRALGALRRSS